MPNRVFTWTVGEVTTVQVRVSLIQMGEPHFVLTRPAPDGDAVFSDAIPIHIWKRINRWVEEQTKEVSA